MFIFLADAALTELSTTVQEGATYNYKTEFVNMLLTLAFIIGLIFVTVWVLKKIMRSRIHQLNKSTAIKVLERRVLNPKASLYLVDVLGKGIVIAESSAGIHVVTEFPKEVDVQLALEELQQNAHPIKESFAEKIRKLAAKNA